MCRHAQRNLLTHSLFLQTAKCGNLLNDSLIHLSNNTIHGSSFNESWEVPLLDGNYSWCPVDSDLTRKLEIDLGKRRKQLLERAQRRVVRYPATTRFSCWESNFSFSLAQWSPVGNDRKYLAIPLLKFSLL